MAFVGANPAGAYTLVSLGVCETCETCGAPIVFLNEEQHLVEWQGDGRIMVGATGKWKVTRQCASGHTHVAEHDRRQGD